jgi:putative sterol carrier protein
LPYFAPAVTINPYFSEQFMSVLEVIKKLPAAFNAADAADVECVLQFNTSTPAYATIKGGACSVNEGSAAAADVTLTIEDEDFIALMKGELYGMTAFMTGKLQIEGDLMLAQRVTGFFDTSKLG